MDIELKGKKLIPRELLLIEIEQVLENLKAGKPHIMEAEAKDMQMSAYGAALSVLPPDSPSEEIEQQLRDFEYLAPSQVRPFLQEVINKNPSLAREIDGLATLAEKLLAADQAEITSEQGAVSTPSLTSSDGQPAV